MGGTFSGPYALKSQVSANERIIFLPENANMHPDSHKPGVKKSQAIWALIMLMALADDKDGEYAMKLRLLDTSDLQSADVYKFGNRLQTGLGTSSKWCFSMQLQVLSLTV